MSTKVPFPATLLFPPEGGEDERNESPSFPPDMSKKVCVMYHLATTSHTLLVQEMQHMCAHGFAYGYQSDHRFVS